MKKIIIYIICLLSANGIMAQCTDNGNYWNESWVSCTTTASPNPIRGNSHWILYEFHETQYIDETHVWNANRTGESSMGANQVIIDYTADGTNWVELGTFTFPQAPETSDYAGFTGPEFEGVMLSKILVTVVNTHGSSSCASIAEMQFKIDQTACYGIVDICGVCDGPGEINWYIDQDGDGLGSNDASLTDCLQPAGYVANNSDLCDNGGLGWAEIGPLFSDNGCTGCHTGAGTNGLSFDSYADIAAGGNYCGPNLLTGESLVGIITTLGYNACGTIVEGPTMNDRVGGAFDAQELDMLQKWIDGGAPELCTDFCLTVRNVNNNFNTGDTAYEEASNQVIANNLIQNGATITYDAGNQICLEPNFEVQEGATFHALIDGCDTAASTTNSTNAKD